MIIDPPVSVPRETGPNPALTLVAEPLELPDGFCSYMIR